MAIKYKLLIRDLNELIQKQIEQGINKLPTEQELCHRYKVSRQTVRYALSFLEQDGVIEKRHGSGSYITGRAKDASLNTAAILISNEDDYVYPSLLENIKRTLSDNHFKSVVYPTNNSLYLEREILTKLLQKKPLPRGLIVEGIKTTLPNPNIDLYIRLQKNGVAIVFLHNSYPQLTDCPLIKEDNAGGSRQLTESLLAQGHHTIAGIFQIDERCGIERYHGFMETMHFHRLSVKDEQICWFDSNTLQNARLNRNTTFLQSFVSNTLFECPAVICHNNEIAYWLFQELSSAGLSIPEDITIAAFDHTYLNSYHTPFQFTLSHGKESIGTYAAMTFLNKIKGFPETILEIPWELHHLTY